jgi:cellulose synthase/poly-beta-1,6-N-acetylglucosamine synthase-like glycosyltransferase
VANKVLAEVKGAKVRLAINPRPSRNVSPKSWVLRIGMKIAKSEFAQSEFLALLDDDTIIPPQGFRKVASIAKSGKAVVGLPTYFSRSNFLSR